MAEYKLYCLDGQGRIHRRFDLVADDDSAAVAAARDMAPEHDCEIWSGTRKVALMPAGGDPVWNNG